MAALPQRAKKSKKGRKHGRNLPFCKSYAARHQGERNAILRIARYLKGHQSNGEALAAFDRNWLVVYGRQATNNDRAGYLGS